jgi:hypothetical protein
VSDGELKDAREVYRGGLLASVAALSRSGQRLGTCCRPPVRAIGELFHFANDATRNL